MQERYKISSRLNYLKLDNINISSYFEILLFSLCFIVNPFVSIVIYFLVLIFTKKRYFDFSLEFFSFLLIIFLCLVNQTKFPENDYYYHAQDYKNALQYNYIEYIYSFGKEPLYFTYVFVLSFLTSGDYRYWNFFNTFVSYFFIFNSVYFLLNARKIRPSDYLFTIFFFAFLPQLFSLSIHIERQFIATSIMMYSISRNICSRKSLIFDLSSVLIHSSLLFIFLLKQLRFIKEKVSAKNYYKFFGLMFLVIFYQIVAYYFSSFFVNIPFIGYIFERASKDTKYELEPLGILEVFLATLPIFAFILNIIKGRSSKYNIIYNLSLILSVFILINIHQAELSNRFLFFLLFFLPLLYLDLTRNVYHFLKVIFCIILLLYFLYKLEYGIWTYLSISELVTSSIFNYFSFDYSKILN